MHKYRIKKLDHESKISIDFSECLNAEQYAVVMHGDGPMLVLAGAGTGKTTAVTYRVARLVQTGVSPDTVLLLTFTNKAAREMMKRAEQLIGDVRGVWGGTFHHLCNMVLRQHAGLLGFSTYTIMDREDSKDMVQDCLAGIKYDGILPKPAVLVEIIGLSKNIERPLEEVIQTRFPFLGEVAGEVNKVFAAYEEKKRKLNLMDFDDLLLNTHRLLTGDEAVRTMYQERFHHILVDEYQDTNHIQASIVDILAGLHRNLMVVGDDAQSIYSFRGADFENIIRFPERYPDARIFKLTTNYRSTPEILELANRSIEFNSRQFHKDLHSVQYAGERPELVALNDIYEQAQFTASRIIDLTNGGEQLKEIAVLYRSHYQSMELQLEFQKRGIPFEVRSGLRFFEQAHIKDILSYLRVILNPADEMSWKRVLRLIPGIGNATALKIYGSIMRSGNPLEAIFTVADLVPRKSMDAFLLFLNAIKTIVSRDAITPAAAIETIMANGYEQYLFNTYPNAESRVEDITQVSQYSANYASVADFISDLSLQSAAVELVDPAEPVDDAVVLSSVHQAKGLEWRQVIVIGLNDGRFPSVKALKNGDEEEERRLFYVAVTRAKQGLSLCYTLTDRDTKGLGFLKPSRFVRELDERLYEKVWVERE